MGFQSGSKVDTLKELKLKAMSKWSKDDIRFLLNIYKYAKNSVKLYKNNAVFKIVNTKNVSERRRAVSAMTKSRPLKSY